MTRVDETYWGYVLRTECKRWLPAPIPRAGLFGLALILAAAAASLWTLPLALASAYAAVVVAALSGAMAIAGAVLLWRASGLTRSEMHFDQSRFELRHVVRNFTGRTRVIARYCFCDISDVCVQSDPGEGIMGRLLLRLGDGDGVIVAAHAPEHQLSVLRRRIARDLRRSRLLKPARFSDRHAPAAAAADEWSDRERSRAAQA